MMIYLILLVLLLTKKSGWGCAPKYRLEIRGSLSYIPPRVIAAEGSVFYCVYLRDCIIWSFWSKKCHFRLFSIRVPYNLVVYAVGRHQFLTDCRDSLQQSSSYVYLGSHWSRFLIFCFVAFLFYFYPTITFLSNLVKNVIKTWSFNITIYLSNLF